MPDVGPHGRASERRVKLGRFTTPAMELMAEKIMPAVNAALGRTVAAE